MENPIVGHYITVTIFSLMLAIGVNHSFRQVTYLARRPGLLVRSLLSVVVVVPGIVAVLLWALPLPPAVATGLAVLAAAPGAPLTTKRIELAGGELPYAVNLQLTLALLAVVVTPLILSVYFSVFDLSIEKVSLRDVARQVARVTFLPVMVGFLVRRFLPGVAVRIGNPLNVLANILLIGLVLLAAVFLAITPDLRAMLNPGGPALTAIALMVALSLAAGHFLGGPNQEKRAVLAVASIARNVGLALFIAGLSDYGQKFVPTLLAYLMLGGLLGVPYTLWSQRRVKRQSAVGRESVASRNRLVFICFWFSLHSFFLLPAVSAAGGDGIYEPGGDLEEELAKTAQNPVANIISLPFQNNVNFNFGPREQTQNILNIQPVIPFAPVADWNVITRTIVPVISQPPLFAGDDRENGLGDITFTAFLSPAAPGRLIWGAGPILLFPSATDEKLGTEKWGAGPSAVVLTIRGPWLFGVLANHIWSFAGAGDRDDVNQTLIQPFINYNFRGGWFLTSSPIITANWEADNDQRWTVPVGGGGGKLFFIGRQPVNASVQVFYNAEKPDFREDWSLRLNLQFLFPK